MRRPTRESGASTLVMRDVCASYGPVQVLRDVSLEVGRGEVVALLGPNGSGKTTTLRAICGAVSRRGSISVGGERVDRCSTYVVARKGVGHVPEGRGTFTDLTVDDNLGLGLLGRRKAHRSTGDRDLARVLEICPILGEFKRRRAGELSGGQQQILAVARAILARPDLLLLDEPSNGLAPVTAQEIFALVGELLVEWDLAVLLAEANTRRAFSLASRAYVLGSGEIVAAGDRHHLDDERLELAYLGSNLGGGRP